MKDQNTEGSVDTSIVNAEGKRSKNAKELGKTGLVLRRRQKPHRPNNPPKMKAVIFLY